MFIKICHLAINSCLILIAYVYIVIRCWRRTKQKFRSSPLHIFAIRTTEWKERISWINYYQSRCPSNQIFRTWIHGPISFEGTNCCKFLSGQIRWHRSIFIAKIFKYATGRWRRQMRSDLNKIFSIWKVKFQLWYDINSII